MSGHHAHTYAAASVAFYVALVPFALLFLMMFGAKFFDGIRRARKPVPARPPAIIALAPVRRALLSVD